MPDFIKVIILGIIEGLTEFLPISSTGHLIVGAALLNFGGALGGTFEIFIQFGAIVAVVVYFFTELFQQVKTVRSDPAVQRLWIALVFAFVPAGLIGFFFNDAIKEVLFNPTVVAIALIMGGIVFLVIEKMNIEARATTHKEGNISVWQALGIGMAQVLALIPGVSRSGSSIVGGMFAGLDRATATRFSFFLAIPTLGIATIYDLVRSLDHIQGSDVVNLLLGAVVSGIVAWITIRWLLNFVASHSFTVFGYYRIAAGIVILVMSAAGAFGS